jgi:hypothetical protein
MGLGAEEVAAGAVADLELMSPALASSTSQAVNCSTSPGYLTSSQRLKIGISSS